MSASTSQVYAIAPGFRLQWEQAQNCHVLLYPQGMVRLNPSAAAILKHCDGERSILGIVAELEAEFDADDLAEDVKAFVEMAVENRWLEFAS